MGKLIIIEGMDGSGTTTQTKMLADYLKSLGHSVAQSAEPTASALGHEARRWLREPIEKNADLLTMLALCFAADRMHHVHFGLKPELLSHDFVLVDRYVMSSMVYQGLDLPTSFVALINQFALKPDFTLLLDVEPSVAFERIARRHGSKDFYESMPMLKRLRERYVHFAQHEPTNIVVIDGHGGIAQVHAHVASVITQNFLVGAHDGRSS